MNASKNEARAEPSRLSLLNLILYHVGVVAITFTFPILSFLLDNRHSIFLAWDSNVILIGIFFAVPAALLIVVDLLLAKCSERAAALFRLIIVSASGYCIGSQAKALLIYNLSFGAMDGRIITLLASLSLVIGHLPIVGAALAAALMIVSRGKAGAHFFPIAGTLSPLFLVYYLIVNSVPAPVSSAAPVQHVFPEKRGPVIIFIFDSLSIDAMVESGAISSRYPAMRELSEQGWWIRDAFTNYDFTAMSIPSIMTGKRDVTTEEIRTETTIFDIVASRYRNRVYGVLEGYSGILGNRPYCVFVDERDYHRRFIGGLTRQLWRTWLYRSLRDMYDMPPIDWRIESKWSSLHILDNFFDALRGESIENNLFFVHVFFPHLPFVMDRDGGPRERERRTTDFRLARTDDDMSAALLNYRKEIDYCDRIVAQTIEMLRSRGLWDSAVLIVTSDHGILRGREARGADDEANPDIVNNQSARVPMIIKPPAASAGRTPGRSYQHIDLVPSLVDLLELPDTRERYDGRSLFSDYNESRPAEVITQNGGVWRRMQGHETWVKTK